MTNWKWLTSKKTKKENIWRQTWDSGKVEVVVARKKSVWIWTTKWQDWWHLIRKNQRHCASYNVWDCSILWLWSFQRVHLLGVNWLLVAFQTLFHKKLKKSYLRTTKWHVWWHLIRKNQRHCASYYVWDCSILRLWSFQRVHLLCVNWLLVAFQTSFHKKLKKSYLKQQNDNIDDTWSGKTNDIVPRIMCETDLFLGHGIFKEFIYLV